MKRCYLTSRLLREQRARTVMGARTAEMSTRELARRIGMAESTVRDIIAEHEAKLARTQHMTDLQQLAREAGLNPQ